MSRIVVVLFGPPGAGKTTAARQSGLEVYDRDDPQWAGVSSSEFMRRVGLELRSASMRAVVVRTGATSRDRQLDLVSVAATHAWVMSVPAEVCHHQVRMRGYRSGRGMHAGIEKWWVQYDRQEDTPVWPGQWPADLEATPSIVLPELAPMCGRCKRRHLAVLPCWLGAYRKAVIAAVFATQPHVCWMCGEHADTVDHVLPRSLGGTDELSNTRPACARHNAGRGNTLNPFTVEPVAVAAGAPAVSSRFRRSSL